jgi:hypothetical protein
MPVDRPSDLIEALLEPIEPRPECFRCIRPEVESSSLWQPRTVNSKSC